MITLDVAVLGDWVNFTKVSGNLGVIEKIEKRKNYLSRKAGKARGSLKRGERLEQIIAANLDTLFIVNSIKEPVFNNRFLDRLIVASESSKIEARIIINKIDLDKNKKAIMWEQFYKEIGYKVFVVSAINKLGLNELKESLNNKVNLFWGKSGVGKSSILNAMFPELNFNVADVSRYSSKGTHTTVTGEMREVKKNTFIIDTPGIREIDPFGIKKEDLGHYFKEFVPYLHYCKFNTCIHEHEPGCAVVDAVESGEISFERYESYLNLLNTIEDDMIY